MNKNIRKTTIYTCIVTWNRVFSLILGLSPCEAFASLFLYPVFVYRQKNPLKYSIPLFDHKNLCVNRTKVSTNKFSFAPANPPVRGHNPDVNRDII